MNELENSYLSRLEAVLMREVYIKETVQAMRSRDIPSPASGIGWRYFRHCSPGPTGRSAQRLLLVLWRPSSSHQKCTRCFMGLS